jgi:hypothetical protein
VDSFLPSFFHTVKYSEAEANDNDAHFHFFYTVNNNINGHPFSIGMGKLTEYEACTLNKTKLFTQLYDII